MAGQYLKIRKDASQEKPGFFAMANAPGGSDKLFEFLIKRTDGSAWICDAAEVYILSDSCFPNLVFQALFSNPSLPTRLLQPVGQAIYGAS